MANITNQRVVRTAGNPQRRVYLLENTLDFAEWDALSDAANDPLAVNDTYRLFTVPKGTLVIQSAAEIMTDVDGAGATLQYGIGNDADAFATIANIQSAAVGSIHRVSTPGNLLPNVWPVEENAFATLSAATTVPTRGKVRFIMALMDLNAVGEHTGESSDRDNRGILA